MILYYDLKVLDIFADTWE